jgi:quercetin dioxygenase-like cupin family protein
MCVQMLTWKKGNGSRPHFHPNDRYFLVLDGTWWVGTGTKWDPKEKMELAPGQSFAVPPKRP